MKNLRVELRGDVHACTSRAEGHAPSLWLVIYGTSRAEPEARDLMERALPKCP